MTSKTTLLCETSGKATKQLSSHQGFKMGQVDVAIFVHLHYLNLHASHLSTRWVGAMGGLRDQTYLE